MSKFVIECPSCGRYAQASTSFLAKKKIECSCGYIIDVRTDKITSRVCSHCGNSVVFDQSKGSSARCPVCHEKINTEDMLNNMAQFHCPSCACELIADKCAKQYTCPLCDTVIDVQQQMMKEKERKKGLASVIKYEGDNQTFVWKHPIEDFNLGSQLIVHESQEAVFFRDGQALDLFPAGRYTLTTQNLPALQEIYKLPTNADAIFHSEVYFINKTVQMGLKWGTDSKVRMFDPTSGLHLEIGASGQFNLKVSDSRRLLIKLVGSAGSFTQADVIDDDYKIKPTIGKFKALIITKVKSNLAHIIKDNGINILEVDEHLDTISEKLRNSINESLTEYGLFMPEFFLTTITTPDDDSNFKRLKQQHAEMFLKVREEQIKKAEAEASAERQAVEAQTAARMKIIGAQGEAEAYKLKAAAEAEEMRMKGYTYQQETVRQVGLGAVQNMGNGSAGGLGDIAGLGVSLGAIGGVMGMTREALNPITNNVSAISNAAENVITSDTWNCTCGNKGVVGNFCNNCGAKRPAFPETWDCSCGNKGIVGNFCNICGAKRPAPLPETWDCSCGNRGVVGNFCNNCGKKKGE